jgi:hypothetical protein
MISSINGSALAHHHIRTHEQIINQIRGRGAQRLRLYRSLPMNTEDSSQPSRRRTVEFGKPEQGLSEWANKIRSLQYQVDEDEAREQSSLEAEIAASRCHPWTHLVVALNSQTRVSVDSCALNEEIPVVHHGDGIQVRDGS